MIGSRLALGGAILSPSTPTPRPALPSPRQALEALLLELLDADAMRALVHGLERGAVVSQGLPGKIASPQYLISEAVSLLERERAVDAGLFRALVRERPGQAGRIREVAGRWGVELPELPAGQEPASPYDERRPALPPRYVGRARTLAALEGALARGQGVSLVGDRRIGKSSTLETWARRLRESGRTACLLSGQGPEGSSLPELLRAVAGRPGPEGADAAADALSGWARANAGPPPVLLLDEAETPLQRLDYRFWERMRGMDGRVLLVLATASELDQVYQDRDRTSPFGNTLHLLRLGLLEPGGAEQILGWSAGLLSEPAREQLGRWAGRHPYHLQLYGRLILEAGSAEEALDPYQDAASARFRELWRHLSTRERSELERVGAGERSGYARLRWRGLVDEEGRAFGEILRWWLGVGRP